MIDAVENDRMGVIPVCIQALPEIIQKK